jgi:glycosyltransferase involved in cell wall biosynthesis
MPEDNTRILQLLPALGDGGVERSTIEMAEYLGGLGLTNVIASAGGPLVAAAEAAGTRHVAIPVGSKSPITMVSAARAVARLIDEQSIDIIHARSRAPAWVGLLARRIARRPVRFMTTFHGVYSHGNALKRFYNGAMLRTPVVIANSQFIRRHIVEVYGYPERQVVVAPRGIDPAVFDSAAVPDDLRLSLRAELGAADAAPLIVMASRITGWKGHAVFLDALARSGRPDVRAAFVGSGADTVIADLKQQITRLGLDGRVVFAGSRRDIPAVLAAADLVVSASIRPEAFGRAAIEAQAMETPVIATNHGGSLETIVPGVTGWLVEPGDADAMVAAINEAFASPERLREIGRQGRQHVLANFTTQRMLEAEFSAYRRILDEPA